MLKFIVLFHHHLLSMIAWFAEYRRTRRCLSIWHSQQRHYICGPLHGNSVYKQFWNPQNFRHWRRLCNPLMSRTHADLYSPFSPSAPLIPFSLFLNFPCTHFTSLPHYLLISLRFCFFILSRPFRLSLPQNSLSNPITTPQFHFVHIPSPFLKTYLFLYPIPALFR